MIVSGEVVGRWVAEGAQVPWTHVCRSVGWMSEGKVVAGILYDGFTGASIAMHSRVDCPEKVQREWLFAIFDYPFNELKVKRVTALVPADNEKAIRTNEHLGWKYETVLKDYFPGCDGLVYVMRKEDCRWLGFKKRTSKGLTNALRSFHDAARSSVPETGEETPNA